MKRHDDSLATSAVIPAPDTASSTAAVRSLGRDGVTPVVVSENETAPGYESQYCGGQVRVPDPNRDLPAYEEALLALARRPDIGTILPFREADVYVLARNRQLLEEHVGVAWPSIETVRRVQDRMQLVSAAKSAGVGLPETTTLRDWDDWERPSIIKPRYTIGAPEYATDFEFPKTVTSSTTYVDPATEPDYETVVDDVGHEPIVQEFVPTTDKYGFFALYDHGDPVATFQHRQRRGWKYTGGPSAYRESVDIPALESAGLAMFDELDWHGAAMVEFLRDPETETFKLMEINPRFWSSLPFTVQAGVDFPRLYWLLATEQPIPETPPYTTDIGGHLLWGELLYLHSILAEASPLIDRPSFPDELREIGASVLREPRFDYLQRDDPGPFVRDLRNVANRVIGCRE